MIVQFNPPLELIFQHRPPPLNLFFNSDPPPASDRFIPKRITSTPRWLFGVEHSKLGAVFESMKRHDMLFLVLLVVEDYHITKASEASWSYSCDSKVSFDRVQILTPDFSGRSPPSLSVSLSLSLSLSLHLSLISLISPSSLSHLSLSSLSPLSLSLSSLLSLVFPPADFRQSALQVDLCDATATSP